MAVVKKFGDDQGGNLAALVAYYAFFSLFPLLLVLVTILNYVLQGDPATQNSIKSSVLAQFPIIGDEIRRQRAMPPPRRREKSGWAPIRG